MDSNEEGRKHDAAMKAWGRARLLVWPEQYVLASFALAGLTDAAALVASRRKGFAALVVERDEVSVTVELTAWTRSRIAHTMLASSPLRVITIDVDVDLDVCGFLAPAAARLAAAGVPIVPQCAFKKDHILVREADLDKAVRVLQEWIGWCR